MVRVRVEGLVAVDGPAVAQHVGALGDVVALICVCFGRRVWRPAQDRYGPPAQRLLAERADVRQRGLVRVVWEAVAADHGIEFGVCGDEGFLVRDDGEDRGRQCGCGGVGARAEDGGRQAGEIAFSKECE